MKLIKIENELRLRKWVNGYQKTIAKTQDNFFSQHLRKILAHKFEKRINFAT
jgi:hypothetical protein